LMMSLWDALRMNMMISYQELVRTFPNYMPHNKRSGDLLARLGFEKEGYAKDYLLIDGQWRDHVLTALTTPDWTPGR
ncbi:hypothetical protein U4005_19255, partial [Escherichia coli]|nr:hypothetical protein [Escherichia coli]